MNYAPLNPINRPSRLALIVLALIAAFAFFNACSRKTEAPGLREASSSLNSRADRDIRASSQNS